ncbi:hypothetical protein J541_4197, partial [Acinetobacter pittii]
MGGLIFFDKLINSSKMGNCQIEFGLQHFSSSIYQSANLHTIV